MASTTPQVGRLQPSASPGLTLGSTDTDKSGTGSTTLLNQPTTTISVHHSLPTQEPLMLVASDIADTPRPLPSSPKQSDSQIHNSSQPPGVRQQISFKSPKADPSSISTELHSLAEYKALYNAIQGTPPGIVRQIVRDCWGKCLLGSEYHLAFLTNATLHQASPSTLDRAILDFGETMVRGSTNAIIKHLRTEDLDGIADLIISKASPEFMDKALARRLETIDARPLVNALARAERLGYDVRDIVEDKQGNAPEQVFPSLPVAGPPHPVHSTYPAQPAYQDQHQHQHQQYPTRQPKTYQQPMSQLKPEAQSTPSQIQPNPASNPPLNGPHGIVFCTNCTRPCSGAPALRYHILKHACEHAARFDRLNKDICIHCGCYFGSSGGLAYHRKSNVCGEYSEEATTAVQDAVKILFAVGQRSLPSANTLTAERPIPGRGVTSQPPQTVVSSPVPIPAPMVPAFAQKVELERALSCTTPASSTLPRGPYAHLSQEAFKAFQADMKEAEEYYGNLMREAMKMPGSSGDRELARLKTNYTGKQSIIRRKYGVKLRRTKADMQAIRGQTSPAPSSGRVPKRARISLDGHAATTAASQGSASQSGTPRKRIPVSEMGGLSESSATAETTDPTANLSPSQPRHPKISPVPIPPVPRIVATHQGTSDDPMNIYDSSDSQSEDDDDDIPARPPAQSP